jgi:8-oxo-dGTP diphosphatase
MKPRAAIILIQNGHIALVERWRSGRHYFVFPGGKIKSHETPDLAAIREAGEELGLEVSINRMVAQVWYLGTPQYYFLANTSATQFGHGTGKEMNSQTGSKKGTYLPIWMAVDDITLQPVLPKLLAEYVRNSYDHQWPQAPLLVTYHPPDEMT